MKKISTPLMESLEDSLDTGQTGYGLCKFKSFQDHRGQYSLSDTEYLEVAIIYLLKGNWGYHLGTLNQHHCRFLTLWKIQSKAGG